MEGYKLMKFQSYEISTKKNKSSKNIILCVGIIFTTFLGLFYMALITKVYEKNYTLQLLESKIHGIEKENEKLETEIEKFSSLSRIEKIALNEIGMKLPERIIYFVVNDDEANQVLSGDLKAKKKLTKME